MRKSEIKSFEEKNKKIDFLIKLGYTSEEAEKMKTKISSPTSYLYWMYKEGLSKEDSINKVSLLQRLRSPRCKEYWINKGFSEEDSIIKISSHQDNVSLESTIKSGGTIDDYEKKCKNRKINIDKYISLYGIENGTKKWLEKKKNSAQTIDNMIRIYGEEEGKKRWELYIERQKYSQSEEGLCKKHGPKIASKICNFRKDLNTLCIKKYIETKDNKYLNNTFSKSSQKLFWEIYKKLPDELREKCYFKELNNEFVLIDSDRNYYLYDFVISNINFCIEFNGDLWHANPLRYNSNDLIFDKKACDIWKKDEQKIKLLKEKRNIDTTIIWESEWKKDKKGIEMNIIKKINFLYDNNIK